MNLSGVVGYLNYGYEKGMTLTQSSFSDGSVTNAGHDDYLSENASKLFAGGLVGEYFASNASYSVTISEISVTNVTITGYSASTTGEIVGGTRGKETNVLPLENSTATNVTIVYLADAADTERADLRSASVRRRRRHLKRNPTTRLSRGFSLYQKDGGRHSFRRLFCPPRGRRRAKHPKMPWRQSRKKPSPSKGIKTHKTGNTCSDK